ncbi:MAG: hypothetical protein HY327_02745 [Chloroflexi bacterium]|nr:hypothetical protein [Chloroflexota bacterium]
MSEPWLHGIFVVGIAGSVFFSAYAGMDSFRRFMVRVFYLIRPIRPPQNLSHSGRVSDVDTLSWGTWRLATALIGFATLVTLLWDSGYRPLAVVGLAAGFIPSFVRSQLLENERWHVRLHVRDFISELRLALAFNVTVSQALQHFADRSQTTDDLFVQRVRHHVRNLLPMHGPLAVLSALRDEYGFVEELDELTRMVKAAQRGGMSIADALLQSADSISQNIVTSAELAIEETPTRLILPMLLTLFPTILVLVILPMLDLTMNALTGVRGAR